MVYGYLSLYRASSAPDTGVCLHQRGHHYSSTGTYLGTESLKTQHHNSNTTTAAIVSTTSGTATHLQNIKETDVRDTHSCSFNVVP